MVTSLYTCWLRSYLLATGTPTYVHVPGRGYAVQLPAVVRRASSPNEAVGCHLQADTLSRILFAARHIYAFIGRTWKLQLQFLIIGNHKAPS